MGNFQGFAIRPAQRLVAAQPVFDMFGVNRREHQTTDSVVWKFVVERIALGPRFATYPIRGEVDVSSKRGSDARMTGEQK